jgi:hypothetical protein
MVNDRLLYKMCAEVRDAEISPERVIHVMP